MNESKSQTTSMTAPVMEQPYDVRGKIALGFSLAKDSHSILDHIDELMTGGRGARAPGQDAKPSEGLIIDSAQLNESLSLLADRLRSLRDQIGN